MVLLVLLALLALWIGSGLLGWRLPLRLAALAGLWAAMGGVIVAQGGDLRLWLVLGGVGALLMGYRLLIGLAHRHAIPLPAVAPAGFDPDARLTDTELDRYARHITLREIGGQGQRALKRAQVLVIGAGGLGSPVALYLAAAGVGRITLADDDAVSLSNLQRQILFQTDQTGQPKAQAGAARLAALNPDITVTPLQRRIGAGDVDFLSGFDLVIDGTDSFAGRSAINAACVAARVPLLAGAMAQWEGQVALYDPARDAPCMACIFPQAPAPGTVLPCAEAGVIGALPGVIGSLMALEAIKTLTGAGRDLRGRMLIFDGLQAQTRLMRLSRNPNCPVCGKDHP